ncbi:MAG: hypothetical protein K2G14_05425 [Ruminococcus sp.]|nr:hypothetical protein [Ruminococcus sp.]
MSKGKGFFAKLKKSTIITMVSCASFVVMTFLALLFFIKFPITPSEKFTAGLGRESVYRRNSVEGLEVISATTDVSQTTAESVSSVTTTAQTTAKTSKRTEFTITVTTGKGFLTGGRIPTVPYMPEEDIQNPQETTDDSENYDYNNPDYTDTNYNDYNNDYSVDDYDYDWEY